MVEIKEKKIALVEPYFGGSHKSWAQGFKAHSSHAIEFITLPARHWKWRMQGAAIELADKKLDCDVLIVSDMLDLPTYKSLTNYQVPCAIYFHENQLSYPWSPTDPDVALERDLNYAFINYKSALCADRIFFNSSYHQESFFSALEKLLKRFPDFSGLEKIEGLRSKSSVLYLGLDLKSFDSTPSPKQNQKPLILWNHRWEYDKNPDSFFNALFELMDEGVDFEVAILGEQYRKKPAIFELAKEKLGNRIIQWGAVESSSSYASWLKRADILPVTSNQDFFGISVVEAIYCGVTPLLPKRLAYLEHIKDVDAFYQTSKEFTLKLRNLCNSFTKRKKYSSEVAHYGWEKMITSYDKEIDLLSSIYE